MKGYFGKYGGRFVPEMLITPLEELEKAFFHYKEEKAYQEEMEGLYKDYVGRPTPLYHAENLSRELGMTAKGGKIYLKLESHSHTGAHKINNVVGQVLLAKRMGKKHVLAETGAGQHGLAVASVCARFGLKCTIFMGEIDMRRQFPNVFSMRLLGATVVPVGEGSSTLKDAVNAALKFWVENVDTSYYLLGSALGPHPYPLIVQYFQSIIGKELMWQFGEYEEQHPDVLLACVGGGSNALGLFTPYLGEKVRCIGVEGGGEGMEANRHAVRLAWLDSDHSPAGSGASVGIAQGYKSYFLQNDEGQLSPTHSISAGLDYAGISPLLAQLGDSGRVEFAACSDKEALLGYRLLSSCEGIIPALESSHALGYLPQLIPTLPKASRVVIGVSGRGDKDIFITAKHIDRKGWHAFLSNEIRAIEEESQALAKGE